MKVTTIKPGESKQGVDQIEEKEPYQRDQIGNDDSPRCDDNPVLYRVDDCDEAVNAETHQRGSEDRAGQRKDAKAEKTPQTVEREEKVTVEYENQKDNCYNPTRNVQIEQLLVFPLQFNSREAEVANGSKVGTEANKGDPKIDFNTVALPTSVMGLQTQRRPTVGSCQKNQLVTHGTFGIQNWTAFRGYVIF